LRDFFLRLASPFALAYGNVIFFQKMFFILIEESFGIL